MNKKKFKNVLVVLGGTSGERAISIESGKACMRALRQKGYKVINPQLYEIEEQIRIFSQADKIIAPHGSNLSNIIFCKPETEIYEIGPNFNYDYESI